MSVVRRYAKGGLISLFISLLLLGGITVHAVTQVQCYGRLINYVGIVRGATQRLVKLELMDQPSDGLVEYLDGILADLSGEAGNTACRTPRTRRTGGSWRNSRACGSR